MQPQIQQIQGQQKGHILWGEIPGECIVEHFGEGRPCRGSQAWLNISLHHQYYTDNVNTITHGGLSDPGHKF